MDSYALTRAMFKTSGKGIYSYVQDVSVLNEELRSVEITCFSEWNKLATFNDVLTYHLISVACGTVLNFLRTNWLLEVIRHSPCRAVNTLRLVYKNRSVNAVQGNNRFICSEIHTKHINTAVW